MDASSESEPGPAQTLEQLYNHSMLLLPIKKIFLLMLTQVFLLNLTLNSSTFG